MTEGLYWDEEAKKFVSTHSMLKAFRRCPKMAQYKYVERLKPRMLGKPLRQGTWMHALLETKYKGGNWRDTHKLLSARYSDLFDEEKESVGDLPSDCARMMRSYEWHYAHDHWKIIEVEFVLEAELPDGTLYRGRVDLLVEDEYGLWIVDHKFNAKLPDITFRMLDAQSALYIWAARRMGLFVQGHIWNYVRRKPPTVPRVLKNGSRFYANDRDTDYPTLVRAIKQHGFRPKDYAQELRYQKSLQFRHGEPQRSTYFRRDVLEKSPELLRQVAREALHTSKRMNSYPWDKLDYVERVPDYSCGRMCSYVDLCSLELFGGGNIQNIRRQRFTQVDPMHYYYDDPADPDPRGD